MIRYCFYILIGVLAFTNSFAKECKSECVGNDYHMRHLGESCHLDCVPVCRTTHVEKNAPQCTDKKEELFLQFDTAKAGAESSFSINYYADASHEKYRQTLTINTFIFSKESSSGDDIDPPPTTYWLEMGIKEGSMGTFDCGEDRLLCEKVDSELYNTLKKQSNRLEVETTKIFKVSNSAGSSEKYCSYHYQHLTTLISGRQIELTSNSPRYPCAPHADKLLCNPRDHVLIEHPNGWKYCVWVGRR